MLLNYYYVKFGYMKEIYESLGFFLTLRSLISATNNNHSLWQLLNLSSGHLSSRERVAVSFTQENVN